MLACMALTTFAQEESTEHKKIQRPSPTEAQFNMPEEYVNVRDLTVLPGKTKITIELNNPSQYKELNGVDEILKRFMQEIAFYKDSLQTDGGNVRIDYAIDDAVSFSKIRVKRYAPDGEIFMNRRSDVSRLKIEQDTIHIYVKHDPVLPEWDHSTNKREFMFTHQQQYQITFCLNNYTDIAAIAADMTALRHAFDTLYSTKKKGALQNPYKVPSSTRYNPQVPSSRGADKTTWQPRDNSRFYRYMGLSDLKTPGSSLKAVDYISSDGNIGVGLVRNMLAPYAELGLTWQKQRRMLTNEVYTQMKLRMFVSVYAMFEQDAAKEYRMTDIMFANASIGEGDGVSMGLGYMISKPNNYFKGMTGKMFLDVRLLKKGLTLSPEVIFTNDFKQVYPSLTLKVF